MKRVYVIRTSDDGTIGVYTNKKLVWDKLIELMNISGDKWTLFISTNSQPTPNYSNISKELKECRFATLYSSDRSSIDIEEFTVNR